MAKAAADTTDNGSGEGVVEGGPAVDHVRACEAAGLNPAEIQPGDPALTGVSRDERRDSIDPAFGTLTDEAQALRQAKAAG